MSLKKESIVRSVIGTCAVNAADWRAEKKRPTGLLLAAQTLKVFTLDLALRIWLETRIYLKRSRLARQVALERRLLSQLSDHQLRDIGIHRAAADYESRRRFYDLPIERTNETGQFYSTER